MSSSPNWVRSSVLCRDVGESGIACGEFRRLSHARRGRLEPVSRPRAPRSERQPKYERISPVARAVSFRHKVLHTSRVNRPLQYLAVVLVALAVLVGGVLYPMWRGAIDRNDQQAIADPHHIAGNLYF